MLICRRHAGGWRVVIVGGVLHRHPCSVLFFIAAKT
jgi:hypothetical protein